MTIAVFALVASVVSMTAAVAGLAVTDRDMEGY